MAETFKTLTSSLGTKCIGNYIFTHSGSDVYECYPIDRKKRILGYIGINGGVSGPMTRGKLNAGIRAFNVKVSRSR